tara:strand:- start:3210 stop:4196 length:987 start_codon:yes stop_codon:yes gene_type:complete
MFSPDEWESFTEEWAVSLINQYHKVRRMGGANDCGVDIACFHSELGFEGKWDNYQCKRYGQPLVPTDIWSEIGKVIYHSFNKEFTAPRKYYFVCSTGIGSTLEKLLSKPSQLKEAAEKNWDIYCKSKITSTHKIELSGLLKEHFNAFDFTIFTSKSQAELVQDHSQTGFHAVRFGGGLPARPNEKNPPIEPATKESHYIRQLLDAYSDNLGEPINSASELDSNPRLKENYNRQRERFYRAEGLRTFARDNAPPGTFEALQDEIFHGVVDVHEDTNHNDGLARMTATMAQASKINTSSALAPATKIPDQQGICHQLANADKLIWVQANE